jgi:aspartyl-tRNA(Asn)/glutamyl-tRNA(Gln) amidotransferase subunit C
MSLTPDQIKQVAHLARLELKAGQTEHYARQLTNILEMVGQLSVAQTEDVAPMAHPLDTTQRLRPDAITDPVGDEGRAKFQRHAPAVDNGLYLVPKVIE